MNEKKRVTEEEMEEMEKMRDTPSVILIPKCPQQPELGQAKGKRQELHPILPCKPQGTKHLNHQTLPSWIALAGSCIRRRVEFEL